VAGYGNQLKISKSTACSGGSGSAPTPPPVVVAPPPPPPPPVKREYLWPLCGHITQAPPAGWQDTDGCPDTRWNEDFADFPLSSSFGPRQKASENFRYDYHRGIDIPTPFKSKKVNLSVTQVRQLLGLTIYISRFDKRPVNTIV